MNASFDAIGGTIHCASAPLSAQVASLEVSLNAQQYTSNGVGFTYYRAASVSYMSPDSGPTAGDM